jgi:hypothetical protein
MYMKSVSRFEHLLALITLVTARKVLILNVNNNIVPPGTDLRAHDALEQVSVQPLHARCYVFPIA